MQINGISEYNQNFTALRLKRGAEKYISSMPKKALSFVDGVGEYLKDTKYYHVDIDRDLYISSVSGDRYYYPHNIQKSDKILILRARGGYNTISKKIIFDNANEADKASKFISESETPLVRAGRIAKFLDLQKIKSETIPKEEILQNDPHEVIVQKLINKYGV